MAARLNLFIVTRIPYCRSYFQRDPIEDVRESGHHLDTINDFRNTKNIHHFPLLVAKTGDDFF